MSLLAALVFTVVAIVLFTIGGYLLVSERRRTQLLVRAITSDDHYDESARRRFNRRFARTKPGRWLSDELVSAGITHPAGEVFLIASAVSVLIVMVLWTTLAPLIGLAAIGGGFFVLRAYINRARDRRREAFIAQLPEMARVLGNGTSAGLSLHTSLAMAAQELAEPAKSELLRVTDALRFGRDVESALADMADRMPSRETRVLIGTLSVSARAGGSLITALRDISDTLEIRKETRREIRTTLAQAVATGYIVIALGVGVLFLLNTISPGSVEKMTTSLMGQVALVVSFSLFTLGFFAIRRLTRIEP